MRTRDVAPGVLAAPDSGAPHPGVVMVHDVWGLSDHTRDLATRLAREGFGVLAVDLYRRRGDFRIENPAAWMRGLSDPEVLADLQAGVAFLESDPATAGRRVGIVGFCMGGMYALLAACRIRGLSASVPFYGLLSHEHGILYAEDLDRSRKPVQPLDAAVDLRCPLLAFFGDRDEFVPLADIERLRERLASAAPPAEVVVYAGAGHAFMNDTRPDTYRPEIAARAWSRAVEFLKKELGVSV
jgi:carboxymethylenebutenolidase